MDKITKVCLFFVCLCYIRWEMYLELFIVVHYNYIIWPILMRPKISFPNLFNSKVRRALSLSSIQPQNSNKYNSYVAVTLLSHNCNLFSRLLSVIRPFHLILFISLLLLEGWCVIRHVIIMKFIYMLQYHCNCIWY